jgi:branched-chain amino acid transport system substrate-binding protein
MRIATQARIASAVLIWMATSAFANDKVKIAHIDPLSGPFGLAGETIGKHFDALVDELNASGGVAGGAKFEVAHFDNKGSAQESALLLKQIVDAGFRYVVQGGGSNVAHALSDGVSKHNARNPENAVLYLNYAAQDPALTNEKCSFWHFRFDAHVDMKLEAITNHIALQKSIKKVYLLNQDYAFGQAISRAAREMLARKRPDIAIAGDDLHPMGKVKDFSPYISKIKASGAETVITGNWGTDFSLLVKASKDAALGATFYTLNAQNAGAPRSIGAAGADRIKQVSAWHSNVAENKAERFANDYRKKYKDDFYYGPAKTAIEMLARAMNDAKSIDPLKVAKALEGMKYAGDTGEMWMRADDHQLMQPIYISTFTKAGGKDVRYDVEGTGFGWRTDMRVEPKDTVLPTTCVMNRP